MWPVQIYTLIVAFGVVSVYVSTKARTMSYVFAGFGTVLFLAAGLNSSSIVYNGSVYELLGLRMVWLFAGVLSMIHTFILGFEEVGE